MPTLSPDELPKPKRLFCNTCKTSTNHTCVGDHYHDEDAGLDEPDYYERFGYRLWICNGCDTGTMEQYYYPYFYVDGPPEDTDPQGKCFEYEYHPIRSHSQRPLRRYEQLPAPLKSIYEQVIRAYNHDLGILAAIGIRALLEGICADKKITGKSLEARIENMTAILPAHIVTNLHNLRFIGNTAAHELEPPPATELALAIDICEDLLNFVYELNYKAQALAVARALSKVSAAIATARRAEKIIPFPDQTGSSGAPSDTPSADPEAPDPLS